MTTTRSTVTRKTEQAYAVLFARPREIVCSILRGDILEFREHGRRARFRVSIASAFRYAVQINAMAVGRRVKELRKAGMPLSQARRTAEKEAFA